jgi:hypothetical protein
LGLSVLDGGFFKNGLEIERSRCTLVL